MRQFSKCFIPMLGLLAPLLVSTGATAADVFIDSTVSGCSGGSDGHACSDGAAHLFSGDRVTLINPVSITLSAGVYNITDAALTGYYSAWNFSGGWVWNWAIAKDNGDGTGNIFHVGYSGNIYGSQSAAASAHDGNYGGSGGPAAPLLDAHGGPSNFSDYFTLASTTKLDFFTIDYYTPDNAGGVALKITSVPGPIAGAGLPALLALMGLGVLRRRLRPR